MLKIEREKEVLHVLMERGDVSVHELSKVLYTSESTIRRILTTLEKKGLVHRTYGGAELAETPSHVPIFSDRAKENTAAKQEIARKAAALVQEGSIVFLDQSSSSYFLANELRNKKQLTIVTNNLEIASLLARTELQVYVSGGRLSREMRMCLVGEDAQKIFLEINADFAFFSARSLSEDGTLSDCDRDEICVRNAMLKNAKCRVFLCDSSKYGTTSGYRQCSLDDLHMLISDGKSAQRFAKHNKKLNVL